MTPSQPPEEASQSLQRGRLVAGELEARWAEDAVAVEEPLEIRIRGQAYAILMRTPGRERDLIAGFLASEGLVHGAADITATEACRNPETQEVESNIWNVALAEGISFQPRGGSGMVSASCGLCGAQSLEALQKQLPGKRPQLPKSLRLQALTGAFAQLKQEQGLFAQTAGCHGVGLWKPGETALRDVTEDVGRHNAVDKVLGAQLRADAYPVEEELVLLVSGRISFELVQKAALAGIPVLAGVGMPTSLAVQAAADLGLGLLGWVRDAGANVYAGNLKLKP